MRLTMMSDYALRVLLFAAAHPERLVTIDETQEIYGMSRGHLMKIVGVLASAGILRSQRGRSGGFTLGKPPEYICLGEILRLVPVDVEAVTAATCRSAVRGLGAPIGDTRIGRQRRGETAHTASLALGVEGWCGRHQAVLRRVTVTGWRVAARTITSDSATRATNVPATMTGIEPTASTTPMSIALLASNEAMMPRLPSAPTLTCSV